jgi:hypothetical protein
MVFGTACEQMRSFSVNLTLETGVEIMTFACRRKIYLAECFMLVSSLAYSSNLMMEVTCSSEKAVGFQRIA